jgi:hypothetical protein
MNFRLQVPFINTPLQRGDQALGRKVNRFSGFPRRGSLSHTVETAEAVPYPRPHAHTPLKRGVNESGTSTTSSHSASIHHVSSIL